MNGAKKCLKLLVNKKIINKNTVWLDYILQGINDKIKFIKPIETTLLYGFYLNLRM